MSQLDNDLFDWKILSDNRINPGLFFFDLHSHFRFPFVKNLAGDIGLEPMTKGFRVLLSTN